MVIVAAPHTSNWDFPVGLLIRSAKKFKTQFVGKSSLFKPPFGFVFRALGGIPVDRSKVKGGFVEAVAQVFKEHDQLAITLAPEGTRKRVEKFKTGFYYIAKAADVPIVMVVFNYGEMKVQFLPPFYPTDDPVADMAFIEDQFRGVIGKVAEYSFK